MNNLFNNGWYIVTILTFKFTYNIDLNRFQKSSINDSAHYLCSVYIS